MTPPRQAQYTDERDEALFWEVAIPRDEPAVRRSYLPVVLLACIASVPWYWRQDAPIWAGLPAWVWVTIACSTVISAATARAALLYWRDGSP